MELSNKKKNFISEIRTSDSTMSTEWKTGTQFVTTNDGVKIAFERMGRTGPVVVLLHGQ